MKQKAFALTCWRGILALSFSLFGSEAFSSLQPGRHKDIFIRRMNLRQFFPFFLLLSWQAEFFNRLLNGWVPPTVGMCVSEMKRGRGLSGGSRSTGEGRRGKLKEYCTLQEHLGGLCLWWWKHYWAFIFFSSCEPIESFFMTTVIWREPGKIPCYVICIRRWHTLMQTLVNHRAGCYYNWGWKILFQLKKNKSAEITGESSFLMWRLWYQK